MHHTSTYLLEQVQRILKKCFFWNCGHKNNPSNLPALLMWTLPDLTYLSDPDSIIVSFCASVSQSPKNVLHKIFQNSYMDLLQLLHGFVNVVTWICHVVTSLSNPLPNKTKVVKLVACPKLHVLCFQILEGICDDEPISLFQTTSVHVHHSFLQLLQHYNCIPITLCKQMCCCSIP